jgi:DNA-binding NarL/FixJ family response regulator
MVDDHPIVRYGLRELLDREKDFIICGEAEDTRGALKAVVETKPDLVIVDISLKNSNGLELIARIREKHPHIRMLVLSMHDQAIYAERALRAGALGYIMKQELNETLVDALKAIQNGRIFVSREISDKLMQKILPVQKNEPKFSVDRLSNREFEIFKMLGEGYKVGQIARTLHMSVSTAEYHRANMKIKLGIKSAQELTRIAVDWMQSNFK